MYSLLLQLLAEARKLNEESGQAYLTIGLILIAIVFLLGGFTTLGALLNGCS